MPSWEMKPGRTCWLVPRLPTAPRAAYHQPEVEIVKVTSVEVTVRLPDGTEITTSPDNLRATPPPQVDRKIPVLSGTVNRIAKKHGEELPLF